MNKTDDIDFLLTLHPNGWSTCRFLVGGQEIVITITHVFGDAYYDVMKSLSQLMKKEKETSFVFYGEPGGLRVSMKRVMDRRHMIFVTIEDFAESFGEEIKGFEETIQFEIKEKQLVILVYYQLKKIVMLMKERSFSEKRGGDFPFRIFADFEIQAKEYLELQ